MPRVLFCGVEAVEVREVADLAGSAGDGRGGGGQHLVAVTPALPSSFSSDFALNISCHVTLQRPDGREALALNGFRYEREPQACTIFAVDSFEWTIPQLTSLYVCIWPYLLSAIAGLWLLRGGRKVHMRMKELSRMEEYAIEVAPAREGPL